MKETVGHDVRDIIELFNHCFLENYSTILVKGDDEPIYLPSSTECKYNQIIFAHGYYASALHEISHWLVAGSERRLLEDYGYWYCPDGRDKETQSQFEAMEVAPQSYEWMLSVAANFPFQVSCDNLNGLFEPDHRAFRQRVYNKVIDRLKEPFSERFSILINALHAFYKTPALKPEQFIL
ncbi:elongation factor P hydroxylase [Thorsellia kenyensis]|uniref:Elongation factor P hydroxylase n=1 Tax=Thorsellia kenyensis TaxID=1549888 RepID=A0ABV6CEE1_9GAMM